MPLSEFHQAVTAKGKLESTQSKMTNCTSDVSSFMPAQEFVELLWENGQIVMQGQSNRPKKISFPTAFPSHNVRVQEKDYRDVTIPEIGLFEAIDSTVNDLSPSVPSGNVGLNVQDDDMAPWINYPVEDSLCSEFFSELSGMNPNSLSTQNNIMPTDRSSAFGVKDFHNVEHEHTSKALKEGSEPSRNRTSQLFQLLQQCQSSVPSTKSRVTDFGIGGSSSSSYHGHFQKQDVVATFKPLQPSSGAGLMNFSHFSRPVSLAKANHQNVDRLRSNEKALSTAASANPMESTLIESTRIQRHSDLDLAKVELTSAAKPHREVVSVEQSEAICQGDVARNSHHNNSIANSNSTSRDRHINQQGSTFAASIALGRHETEKGPEAVVASSSVCSGNSAGDVSNDPKHKTKRRIQEGEESGYQSEDLEDESVSIKKPGTGRGTSTKRSRAAEVHNLSERRRRDRINEKMHALQELIPNCNKVDKASMLDEAIEYLKTLQLQVQMMSMGSGLCMPSMMLPPGMQHIHAPPMAHFSPMSVGMRMGMGFGYGMGMLDMNGSPGCPLIPVPPMHAPQFPSPSIPGGPTGLHGMPGSTGLQLFGIPGQGFPVSMPRAPLFSPLSGLTAKGNSMNEVSGMMANPLPVSDAAPSSSKDQQQKNINLEAIQKTSPNKSQVVSEPFKQSQLLGMSNQALHVSGNGAFKSINNTGNASTNTTSCG